MINETLTSASLLAQSNLTLTGLTNSGLALNKKEYATSMATLTSATIIAMLYSNVPVSASMANAYIENMSVEELKNLRSNLQDTIDNKLVIEENEGRSI